MRQFGKTNDILFLEFACRFQNELLLMSSQLILLFMNDWSHHAGILRRRGRMVDLMEANAHPFTWHSVFYAYDDSRKHYDGT